MRVFGVLGFVVLVSCSSQNRDDSPYSGSGASSTMPATSDASSAPDSEGEEEGSTAGPSSSGATSAGSSGGPETTGAPGTTSGDSTAASDPTAPMTMTSPTTTMGGDVCDEFCNGCSCPSDQCTMCCALNDQVDTCQGGMCFCFG